MESSSTQGLFDKCDICEGPCFESEGDIVVPVTDSKLDNGHPAVVVGTLLFNQPYRIHNGLVCERCKLTILKQYVATLEAKTMTNLRVLEGEQRKLG